MLSRAEFLAVVASGVPAMLGFLGGSGERPMPLVGQGAGGPVRNKNMVAVAESQGTLLVTENGRGLEADLGCRLNPVAREIWLLATGEHSIEQIAEALSRRFAIPYEVAFEDASAFIQMMMEHGLFSIQSCADRSA